LELYEESLFSAILSADRDRNRPAELDRKWFGRVGIAAGCIDVVGFRLGRDDFESAVFDEDDAKSCTSEPRV